MSTPVEISDARRAAFAGLIDYAGLFPPASLDMDGAVAGYRAARSSGHAWMVERFITPASRLEELAAVLIPSMTAAEPGWRLSVIADAGPFPAFAATHDAMGEFAAALGSAATIQLVEARLPSQAAEADIGEAAVSFVRSGVLPFLEMPSDALPLDELTAVRRNYDVAIGAKLRCGGVTADLFPSPARVARFIAGCVERSLPFKCTAGLHRPVRYLDPATGFVHHGFLNLLVASLAAPWVPESMLIEIIEEADPGAFEVNRSGLSWHQLSFTASQVAELRGSFVGYGSCDFAEPVADLIDLGMLP